MDYARYSSSSKDRGNWSQRRDEKTRRRRSVSRGRRSVSRDRPSGRSRRRDSSGSRSPVYDYSSRYDADDQYGKQRRITRISPGRKKDGGTPEVETVSFGFASSLFHDLLKATVAAPKPVGKKPEERSQPTDGWLPDRRSADGSRWDDSRHSFSPDRGHNSPTIHHRSRSPRDRSGSSGGHSLGERDYREEGKGRKRGSRDGSIQGTVGQERSRTDDSDGRRRGGHVSRSGSDSPSSHSSSTSPSRGRGRTRSSSRSSSGRHSDSFSPDTRRLHDLEKEFNRRNQRGTEGGNEPSPDRKPTRFQDERSPSPSYSAISSSEDVEPPQLTEKQFRDEMYRRLRSELTSSRDPVDREERIAQHIREMAKLSPTLFREFMANNAQNLSDMALMQTESPDHVNKPGEESSVMDNSLTHHPPVPTQHTFQFSSERMASPKPQTELERVIQALSKSKEKKKSEPGMASHYHQLSSPGDGKEEAVYEETQSSQHPLDLFLGMTAPPPSEQKAESNKALFPSAFASFEEKEKQYELWRATVFNKGPTDSKAVTKPRTASSWKAGLQSLPPSGSEVGGVVGEGRGWSLPMVQSGGQGATPPHPRQHVALTEDHSGWKEKQQSTSLVRPSNLITVRDQKSLSASKRKHSPTPPKQRKQPAMDRDASTGKTSSRRRSPSPRRRRPSDGNRYASSSKMSSRKRSPTPPKWRKQSDADRYVSTGKVSSRKRSPSPSKWKKQSDADRYVSTGKTSSKKRSPTPPRQRKQSDADRGAMTSKMSLSAKSAGEKSAKNDKWGNQAKSTNTGIFSTETESDKMLSNKTVGDTTVSDKMSEASTVAKHLLERHRKIAAVQKELDALKKIQSDWLCALGNKPDSVRNPVIQENQSSQCELHQQIQDILQGKDVSLRPPPASSLSKSKAAVTASTKGGRKKKTGVDEEESAGHCCVMCQVICDSLEDFLLHLHSQSHNKKVKHSMRPWQKESLKKYSKETPMTSVRGEEFLMGTAAFYCFLCSELCSDSQVARAHLTSQDHHQKYKDYLSEQPTYEKCYQQEQLRLFSVGTRWTPDSMDTGDKAPSTSQDKGSAMPKQDGKEKKEDIEEKGKNEESSRDHDKSPRDVDRGQRREGKSSKDHDRGYKYEDKSSKDRDSYKREDRRSRDRDRDYEHEDKSSTERERRCRNQDRNSRDGERRSRDRDRNHRDIDMGSRDREQRSRDMERSARDGDTSHRDRDGTIRGGFGSRDRSGRDSEGQGSREGRREDKKDSGRREEEVKASARTWSDEERQRPLTETKQPSPGEQFLNWHDEINRKMALLIENSESDPGCKEGERPSEDSGNSSGEKVTEHDEGSSGEAGVCEEVTEPEETTNPVKAGSKTKPGLLRTRSIPKATTRMRLLSARPSPQSETTQTGEPTQAEKEAAQASLQKPNLRWLYKPPVTKTDSDSSATSQAALAVKSPSVSSLKPATSVTPMEIVPDTSVPPPGGVVPMDLVPDTSLPPPVAGPPVEFGPPMSVMGGPPPDLMPPMSVPPPDMMMGPPPVPMSVPPTAFVPSFSVPPPPTFGPPVLGPPPGFGPPPFPPPPAYDMPPVPCTVPPLPSLAPPLPPISEAVNPPLPPPIPQGGPPPPPPPPPPPDFSPKKNAEAALPVVSAEEGATHGGDGETPAAPGHTAGSTSPVVSAGDSVTPVDGAEGVTPVVSAENGVPPVVSAEEAKSPGKPAEKPASAVDGSKQAPVEDSGELLPAGGSAESVLAAGEAGDCGVASDGDGTTATPDTPHTHTSGTVSPEKEDGPAPTLPGEGSGGGPSWDRAEAVLEGGEGVAPTVLGPGESSSQLTEDRCQHAGAGHGNSSGEVIAEKPVHAVEALEPSASTMESESAEQKLDKPVIDKDKSDPLSTSFVSAGDRDNALKDDADDAIVMSVDESQRVIDEAHDRVTEAVCVEDSCQAGLVTSVSQPSVSCDGHSADGHKETTMAPAITDSNQTQCVYEGTTGGVLEQINPAVDAASVGRAQLAEGDSHHQASSILSESDTSLVRTTSSPTPSPLKKWSPRVGRGRGRRKGQSSASRAASEEVLVAVTEQAAGGEERQTRRQTRHQTRSRSSQQLHCDDSQEADREGSPLPGGQAPVTAHVDDDTASDTVSNSASDTSLYSEGRTAPLGIQTPSPRRRHTRQSTMAGTVPETSPSPSPRRGRGRGRGRGRRGRGATRRSGTVQCEAGDGTAHSEEGEELRGPAEEADGK
ncbi:uncharacterized protein LOC143281154 [Babylonia areolata]|uniref:uncharacterized protein LOC143281154 n=1 Tax=Babylonia areolata TaxID=304850 RepID=UPI003FD62308